MSVAIGALVLLAAVAGAGPGGRRVRPQVAHPALEGPAQARVDGDLSAALVAVSAQLRAGATPVEAWSRTLGVVLAGPAPTVDALLATTSRPGGSRFRRRLRTRLRTRLLTGLRTRLPRRAEPGAAQRARAVVAAARLSDELGAPLAGVLERIVSAVAADAEAEGERGAALSGPRSTAQVLAWLPVLGVALGALLGADPVGVVLSGGIGTASAVLGIVLVGLGRWWTATLLSRAGRA
ncbi:type II secretion system F family protein [Cellulomonas fengjieae]|uniref:type II secretion system F family protein n=1 Tax=Cellulomonas fengjieae TaxID=2819978 RepID=UPI001AAE459E|nr:type II secretion protein F [Cellulomonas fengjieae]MBO3101833.1 type II secretion protein F [Cellulomonas fengjieae]